MGRKARVHFLMVAVVACLSACAENQPAGSEGVRDMSLIGVRAEAQIAHGWLNVKTLQVHLDTDRPDPKDYILRGVVEGGYFTPEGDIEGPEGLPEAPMRGRVERAWLELTTRRILFAADGIMPLAPCLDGKFDTQTSLFYPATRTVLRETPVSPASAPAGSGTGGE